MRIIQPNVSIGATSRGTPSPNACRLEARRVHLLAKVSHEVVFKHAANMNEVVHVIPTRRPVEENVHAFDMERTGRLVCASVMEDDGHLIGDDVGAILAADEEGDLVCKLIIVSRYYFDLGYV